LLEKISSYLLDLNSSDDSIEYYNKILNYNYIHYIPAVRLEVAKLLNILCTLKKPRNILEIGFGSGVSSLFIQKDFKPDLFISLELDKKRYDRGLLLLENFNCKNIKLININAFEYLKSNKENFDFVFLDSVKREYIDFIDPITNILNPQGVFVIDNTIMSGKVIENNIDKKYLKGIESLKEFNKIMANNYKYSSLFLNIGDGVLLSIKKNELND